MKKGIALFCALLCIVSLAGCDRSGPAAPEAGTPLSTFYQAILDAQPADMTELTFYDESYFGESYSDVISSLYPGLLDIELSQQAFYTPAIVSAPCAIVLVEVKNEADVSAVVDIFQKRIDQGAADTAYPENATVWANHAQVQQSGNFVCMIVLPDGYTIPQDIFIPSEQ